VKGINKCNWFQIYDSVTPNRLCSITFSRWFSGLTIRCGATSKPFGRVLRVFSIVESSAWGSRLFRYGGSSVTLHSLHRRQLVILQGSAPFNHPTLLRRRIPPRVRGVRDQDAPTS
jgi:hypothetical protein